MHVLICSQQWWPEVGIPQKRMNWLVEGLHTRGHSVSVVAAPPHYPLGTLIASDSDYQPGAVGTGKNGETIYRTSFREHSRTVPSRIADQGVCALTSIGPVKRAIADNRPDLILATAPPLPAIMVAYAAHRAYKIPFVVDLRDAWPELGQYVAYADPALPAPTKTRQAGALALHGMGLAIAQALRAADGILATTHAHANALNQRWGVRARVMRNLAELPYEEPNAPRRNVSDQLNVLYAGTIGRAQGVHGALDAVEELMRRGIPVHMKVAGQGAYERYLRKDARRRSLPVEFLGRIPSARIAELQAEADTLLVPLQSWAPLELTVPSKLYDVLASGRHVTLAAQGEAAQIVREAGAGDVVPPMDAQALADLWQELYEHPERLDVAGCGRTWLNDHANSATELDSAIDFLEETLLDSGMMN